MGRRSDPGWRDVAARSLVLGALSDLRPERALLMLEPGGEIATALESGGAEVRRWDRRLLPGGEATPWPPDESSDWIGLRLPKAREELVMSAHAAAARLAADGRLWVYGAKDEGIQSAPARLEEVFAETETLEIGGRCRLIECRGPDRETARGELSDWRQVQSGDSGLPRGWVSWPGCFSHGRLDRGTRLLLGHLPRISGDSSVLDFACGTGPLAKAVVDATEGRASVTGVDHDALSIVAFRENVPAAEALVSDGFSAVEGRRFDWILANPPYHSGKAGSAEVLETLCARAPEFLEPGGRLRLVVQGTHALDPLFSDRLGRIEVLVEGDGFRVWDAERIS